MHTIFKVIVFRVDQSKMKVAVLSFICIVLFAIVVSAHPMKDEFESVQTSEFDEVLGQHNYIRKTRNVPSIIPGILSSCRCGSGHCCTGFFGGQYCTCGWFCEEDC